MMSSVGSLSHSAGVVCWASASLLILVPIMGAVKWERRGYRFIVALNEYSFDLFEVEKWET